MDIKDLLKESTQDALSEENLQKLQEAVEDKAKEIAKGEYDLKLEAALAKQDAEYAEKLETFLEDIDEDHTSKMESLVPEEDNTYKNFFNFDYWLKGNEEHFKNNGKQLDSIFSVIVLISMGLCFFSLASSVSANIYD